METGKAITDTNYIYTKGNASFWVQLTARSGHLPCYDFIIHQNQLKDLIKGFISELDEPLAFNPIPFDVLVYTNVNGSQKLFTTSYSVQIQVRDCSFPQPVLPFRNLTYQEFNLAEQRNISKFNDFK